MIIEPADRLKSTSEYYFSQKLQEIARLRSQGIDVINLGIGSPDMVPAADVIETATAALHSDNNHGYASYRSSVMLREAIAAWYQKLFGVSLNPETQILPLLGSKEGILYVSLAFLNPGDGVLVPNPGYPAYSAVAKLIGARVQSYDLQEKNWEPDFAKLEAMDLSRTKIMWVNYPHMPTGATGSDALFRKLVEFGQRKKIMICNDNPYGLVLNTEAPRSLLAYDRSLAGVVELNSLSKSFNMAGWRVGMALGSEPAINAILQVKSNVDSGMFLPVQAGAAKALSLGDEWHAERNALYRARRDGARKIFDAIGFTYTRDQVGLFVWAKAPAAVANVETFLNQILAEAHVFLTPGFIFGSNGERFARISLCASEATFKKALARIQAVAQTRGEGTK